MQEIKYPYFSSGRIFKQEMLQILRDFPRDVLDVYNEDLSDGIVCGLTPKVDKDIITFSKGIVKYNGRLYVMSSPTSLSYKETDAEVAVKLNFYEEIRNKDYLTQYTEIEIDPSVRLKESQLELGRFKLKKGAYLRSAYKDLYDFTTEYNTINIVHALYAGYKEPTISGLILKYFAREALSARTQEHMDITFCMMCLNSPRVERQVICQYIAYKLEEELQDMTNEGIHGKLVKILEKIKREGTGLKRKKSLGQKIIVD